MLFKKKPTQKSWFLGIYNLKIIQHPALTIQRIDLI